MSDRESELDQPNAEPAAEPTVEEPGEMPAVPPAPEPTSPRVTPRTWRYAADAWRWNRRLNQRYVNTLLKIRSAAALPDASRARFRDMGLPAEATDSTLSAIHSLTDWPQAWVETAQRYLGDSRRQVSARNLPEAARARYYAALCFHAAQIYVENDPKTVGTCRAAAASLYGQAQPYLFPRYIRLSIPWRSVELPAYFVATQDTTRPAPLAVFLNGFTTAKEEALGWIDEFLRAGVAVLAIDSPGTGEATPLTTYSLDHDDLSDGILAFAQAEPTVNATQVAMIGVSLGGAQAIACAAYDRRLLTAIALTPPYEPSRWLRRANTLLLNQLASITGAGAGDLPSLGAAFDLTERAERVRCPVLVFGAGRDVVVPPTEAQRLAARLGERAALVWYERGGHCLYENLTSWTAEAAEWIHLVAAGRGQTPTWSTQVDHAADVAHMAAQHLEGFAAPASAPPPAADSAPDFDDPDLYPADSPAVTHRPEPPEGEPAK